MKRAGSTLKRANLGTATVSMLGNARFLSLLRHLCPPSTLRPTTASSSRALIYHPSNTPNSPRFNSTDAIQTHCASCNTGFHQDTAGTPGFFVEPKKTSVKTDNDRFNSLINNMSDETLEFLAREQNIVTGDAPFDVREAKKGYTEKLKSSSGGPRVCLRCHELRQNSVDERPVFISQRKEALAAEEEARIYNQEILDQISAEPDSTVFLTCSIHEFPANVPVFLRKRRNLRLILTKAEGVVYVPQVNSVNVQLWAAAQMQQLGFKLSAEEVHFFSAEHDRAGGYHQFSLHELQRAKNAFIVGYANSGKTSLWNVLKELQTSREASELRSALAKPKRRLAKWKNTSWHPEHTLQPAVNKTPWGKLFDMPAFKRVNSPWGLIKPANNSYVTDKQLLTENGRKFGGNDAHIKKNQVALSSGLFGVETSPGSAELMVWTSLPGQYGLAKHTNVAKAAQVMTQSETHPRAEHNLFEMGNKTLPQLVELGSVEFDNNDGLGLEVAFEGAGFARIKRTGSKLLTPRATLWGFPGQVFAFRQPLCEIMLNNQETVKGYFGLRDPNWQSNRRPDPNYKVDFTPARGNLQHLGGYMYRVKEGSLSVYPEPSRHSDYSESAVQKSSTKGKKSPSQVKKTSTPTEIEGDDFLTVDDLQVMDTAEKTKKQGSSPSKGKKSNKSKKSKK